MKNPKIIIKQKHVQKRAVPCCTMKIRDASILLTGIYYDGGCRDSISGRIMTRIRFTPSGLNYRGIRIKNKQTRKQQRDWFVFVQLPMTRWRMRLGIADNGNRTVATPSNRIKFRFGWQSRRYATHRLCLAYDRHHYYLPLLSSLIT